MTIYMLYFEGNKPLLFLVLPPFKNNKSYFSLLGLLTKYNEKNKVIYHLTFIYIFHTTRINQKKFSKFSLFKLFIKKKAATQFKKKYTLMLGLFPIK